MQASVNEVVLFRVRLRLYNRHFNYFNFFSKQKSFPFLGAFFALLFLFCFKEVKGIFVFNNGGQQGLSCVYIQGISRIHRCSS